MTKERICKSTMHRLPGAEPSSDDMQAALAKAQREAGPIVVEPVKKRNVTPRKNERWGTRLVEELRRRKDV
jgi:hypothetical protein